MKIAITMQFDKISIFYLLFLCTVNMKYGLFINTEHVMPQKVGILKAPWQHLLAHLKKQFHNLTYLALLRIFGFSYHLYNVSNDFFFT